MRRFSLIALLVVVVATTSPVSASVSDAQNPGSWLDGFTMVVVDSDTPEGLHLARKEIQARGGRVAIMSLPSTIMGWVPFEIRNELIGVAGITAIHYTEVRGGDVDMSNAETRHMARFFNDVVNGEIQKRFYEQPGAAAAPKEWPSGSDALQRPPVEMQPYLENLERMGLDVDAIKDSGQLLSPNSTAGASDTMAGTISVTLFFVESDGSGSDPNTYTWTDQHQQDYINGVNVGLAWWSSKAPVYFDCWAAFFVRFNLSSDLRCQQQYEPVLHTSGFASTWVDEVMTNFGYFGNHFSQVDAFNNWQLSTYGTDRAYSAFIGYNPPPAPDQFVGGGSAFAYLTGPYTVLLYRSFSWNVDQVFTHESGHIFGACDEYSGSGCSCTNCIGLQNQNCHLCSGAPCMMKSNDFQLCPWTPAQVGWASAGCAPPPLTPPTATSISPALGQVGVTGDFTVTGANLLYGAFIDLGPDVTINSSTFVNSTTLDVNLTVNNDAPLGLVDMTVSNRDLQNSVVASAFDITPTRQHYASPTGNNVFPYITPTDAATSLTDAISAAGDGDSVLVATQNLANINLFIDVPLTVLGAWDSGFTTRDLATGKTAVDLLGNATVNNANGVLIDGFIFENGDATSQTLPIPGEYGGGIRVLSSTVTISNCDIQNNAAFASYTAGGGVYASQSTVTMDNCLVTGNSAGQGAGLHFDGCTGTISNCTITANDALTSTPAAGGYGVFLQNCNNMQFIDNAIDGNTTSSLSAFINGAGVAIDMSAAISITGGSISGNATGPVSNGGGVHVDSSVVSIVGVALENNTATLFGGAVNCGDAASTVTMVENTIRTNNALLGGGVYFSAGTGFFEHNLFAGNTASSANGGIALLNVTGGHLIGNTLDGNSAPTAAGVALTAAAIDVFNNIVANSVGSGMVCTGTPANISYNNVWNSSGLDYDGCAMGTGGLSADPLFVDAPNGDYHLAVHSPCIDAGNPSATYNDPDGSRGDMGIYGSHAFTMDQPIFVQDVSAATGASVTLSWSSNPEGDVSYYAVYKDTIDNFVPSAANLLTTVNAPDTMVVVNPPDTCYYRVGAVDSDGYAGGFSAAVQPDVVTGIGDGPIAYSLQLYQNVPNPFNPTTRIRYDLEERVNVRLTVYDVQGRRVRQLVRGSQGPGSAVVEWDGRNGNGGLVPSGIYFYRLTAGKQVLTRKMVLLK